MSDMNYVGAVVKILETPKQKFLNSNTFVIRFRAQLPQIRTIRVVTLVVWGNLAHAIRNYYKPNDYILIEGYTSIQRMNPLEVEKVTITVTKVYPFLLNYNRSSSQLY